MLSIKLSCSLWVKLEHFQIGDIELFFSSSDHFAEVHISVRLEHAIGATSQYFIPI